MAVPLSPDEACSIGSRWDSCFTPEGLREHILAHPGLAWRMPGAAEYAVGGWWQGRCEIGLLLEVMSSGHREALVDALLDALRSCGARLAILSPAEEERALGFYRDRGWVSLEEVLVYRRGSSPIPAVADCLNYAPLGEALLPGLMAVEEAAFPWMWRYGADFFREADVDPKRRLRLALCGESVAGYYIVTLHRDFGHVDRLALHPAYRRRGYGAMILARALGDLSAMGGRATGLSTQHDNRASQRLYEAFGFRRTGSYRIHGRWLTDAGPGQGARVDRPADRPHGMVN